MLMIPPAMFKSRLHPQFHMETLTLFVHRRMSKDVAFFIGSSYNEHNEETLQSFEFLDRLMSL